MTQTTEQILALADIMNMSQCYPDREHFARAVENAAIESYKAELLKEVGEPVGYRWRVKGYGDNKSQFCPDWGFTSSRQTVDEDDEPLFTSDQVAAAIAKATKPLESEVERLKRELRRANYELTGECPGCGPELGSCVCAKVPLL